MDCSPPGSSVHGIFQARVLEWGAIAFSEQLLSPKGQLSLSLLVGTLTRITVSIRHAHSTPNVRARRAPRGQLVQDPEAQSGNQGEPDATMLQPTQAFPCGWVQGGWGLAVPGLQGIFLIQELNLGLAGRFLTI